MRFEIITIFPDFFAGIFEHGIVRRAQAQGLIGIGIHDLRAFTHDRHRTVDDRPFGGGEGMVLKPEPLAAALASLEIKARAIHEPDALFPGAEAHVDLGSSSARLKSCPDTNHDPDSGVVHDSCDCAAKTPGEEGRSAHDLASPTPARLYDATRVILLSAQGRPFTQAVARELLKAERVVLICGRYEGVDERINELYCDLELSIGDYVLSGGELAAAVVVDAVMRLVPGVLGNEASGEFESFGVADAEISSGEDNVPRSQHGAGGLLDYPHYTRPAEFGGLRAPEVLMNGDHLQIRRWRREQQLRKTLKNRPDLLEGAALSEEDHRLLEAIRKSSE